MGRVRIITIVVFAFALAIFQVVEYSQGDSTKQPVFTPAPDSPLYVGPMAGRPAVGDCNGDGKLDIVLACGTC
jgi:hypothetical protein